MTLYAPRVASQATPQTADGGEAGAREKPRRRPPSPAQQRAREQFGKVWPQLVRDEARKLRDEGR